MVYTFHCVRATAPTPPPPSGPLLPPACRRCSRPAPAAPARRRIPSRIVVAKRGRRLAQAQAMGPACMQERARPSDEHTTQHSTAGLTWACCRAGRARMYDQSERTVACVARSAVRCGLRAYRGKLLLRDRWWCIRRRLTKCTHWCWSRSRSRSRCRWGWHSHVRCRSRPA